MFAKTSAGDTMAKRPKSAGVSNRAKATIDTRCRIILDAWPAAVKKAPLTACLRRLSTRTSQLKDCAAGLLVCTDLVKRDPSNPLTCVSLTTREEDTLSQIHEHQP